MNKFKLSLFLKKYTLLLIISILLAIFVVGLTLLNPYLIGKSIDLVVGKDNVDFNTLSTYLLYIGLSTIGIVVFQWLMNLVNNALTFNIIRDIRNEAIVKIEKLPLKYIDSHPYGNIISNVINDVDTLADGLLLGFSQLFVGVLTILGTIVFMVILSWQIALVVILLTPVSLFIAKFIASRTHKMFLLQSKIKGEETSFIEEMVNNQKVVQAFSHEKENEEDFEKINKRLFSCSLKASFFSSLVNPSTRFISSSIYAIITLIGAFSVMQGNLHVGLLTSLLSYSNQYTKPFNDISSVITELQNALTCASRVMEFLNEEELPSENDKLILEHAEGNYDISNVFFSYSKDKPLIENFSLKVRKGQKIALVGPTGCGKTTLINLLMRFYNVGSGSIVLDGNNINDIQVNSLRKSIGMVLQDTWLKEGTIKENIILSKEDATEEEIIKASKDAHSYNFIMQLKDGFDTHINEEGGVLSQGQKQLLCITRIMLALPEILILDEATSSIDTRTEMKIQNAFNKLMKGRTSFIVAHRLSTIKSADIILVMNKGNIVESGTHEELLSKKGFYYNLYNSQFAK